MATNHKAKTKESLPLYPLRIKPFISGNFAELRRTHFHAGVDFRTKQREGLKVRSVLDGYIYKISISKEMYGKAVYIQHTNGLVSLYAHLSKFNKEIEKTLMPYGVNCDTGDIEFNNLLIPIKKGKVFARSGNTGTSGGPHLHFEFRTSANNDSAWLINPFIKGLTVKDNTPASLKMIALYPIGSDSKVKELIDGMDSIFEDGASVGVYDSIGAEGSVRALDSVGSGNLYIPTDKLSKLYIARGTVGFGLEALDSIERMPFHYGLYSLVFMADNDTISAYKLDSMPLRDINTIYDHVDKPFYEQSKHKIEKSFDPNNVGVLTGEKNRTYSIRIIASDFNDNTSSIEFSLLFL